MSAHSDRARLVRERHRLLVRISRGLERPMIVLGLIWIVLIVLDLLGRLSPVFEQLIYLIWAVRPAVRGGTDHRAARGAFA